MKPTFKFLAQKIMINRIKCLKEIIKKHQYLEKAPVQVPIIIIRYVQECRYSTVTRSEPSMPLTAQEKY
jgi:hypothetical protein